MQLKADRYVDGHDGFMRRALELARMGAGSTFPNPLVGAVVVSGEEIVGEGYHAKAGSPHAEVEALSRAGERADGATLYINLEPCCHCGLTPPCTDSILEAGIRRVVFSIHDPDPRVMGRGARKLREEGVETVSGVLAREAVELNLPFIHRAVHGMPFIVLKLALTLDGRLTAPGRRYITGRESLRRVHRMRTELEAIAIGSGTLREDSPALDRRLSDVDAGPPVRMVFDTKLEAGLPAHWDSRDGRIVFFCSGEAERGAGERLKQKGIEVVALPAGRGGLDLAAWIGMVNVMGITSVLVEGGGRIASSMIEQGIADRMVLFHAPVFGGSEGVEWFLGESEPRWVSDEGLTLTSVERCGEDVMAVYDRHSAEAYTGLLAKAPDEVGA